MINNYFIAIDGDSVGKILERYILSSDFDNLRKFSATLQSDIDKISDMIVENGDQVYMKGGDNLLGEINDKGFCESIISFVLSLNKQREYSFSIGIGSTAPDTYIALKYAKLTSLGAVAYDSESGFRQLFC